MSYYLMVFEASSAPQDKKKFMEWYYMQTEWPEDHNYQDHSITSVALQSWFKEMIEYFPPMNGPLASNDIDNLKVTDYSIGRHLIYAAFAWSEAEEAHSKMKEIAIKYSVGFFDVSADNGEVIIPKKLSNAMGQKPWWKFW